MPSRPAIITQAEVARVIRAAKKEGAAAVEIRADGTVVIQLVEQQSTGETKPVAKKREIVL